MYLFLMDDEAEFTTRLISFGFSEKEAQLYLHLLKYGPKTPSPLAKSLKTYREDVHRTLASLIEKGMVRPSLDAPTMYAAVDLDAALESAVKRQESELREMEARKQELHELSERQRFRPSDEVATFKIIKSIKELVGIASPLAAATKNEVIIVTPEEVITVASLFGILDEVKKLIGRGASFRMLTDVSYAGIEFIKEALDVGEDVRHLDGYQGVYFAVMDRKVCLHGINLDIKHISLTQPIAMLYTDDSTYAEYLLATFEMLWQQSVPAAQRIEELQKQGPPQV
jgi:sugar-specific transcriptional regulator TrmB